MATQEAICSIRIQQPSQLGQQIQNASQNEAVPNYSPHNYDGVLDPANEPLLQTSLNENQISLNEKFEVPLDIRLKWVKSISDQVFDQKSLDDDSGIRDWDFILSLEGSVENRADDTSSSTKSDRLYPAQYQIPYEILEKITSNQLKVQRSELFALGGLLYEVVSGKELLNELGGQESNIQSRFKKGEFPDDVWGLPYAERVLACWCPQFAKDLLAENKENKSVLSIVTTSIKKHPILFATGGVLSLASLGTLPVLGAVGFGVAGPVAGSAAAGWQASMGMVGAGSLFAWCQSAAMGGAAVGGILATGLAGGGIAVGAIVAGGLDDVGTLAPDLKEKFLIAWRMDIGEVERQRKHKL